jgi:MMP 1-O-methyltransferase
VSWQALDGRGMRNYAEPLTPEQLDSLLSDVEGWLAPREAWELHAAVARHPNPPTVVEVGSWKGRSTIALAAGVRQRGGGRVYAVDPHQGIRRLPELGTSWQDFVSNLRRAGVSEYVEPLRMRSDQALRCFGSRCVDVLFVDGSHVYRDVLADLDGWAPRLAPGATAAFHDWSHYPDVRRALVERVLCESPFRRPVLVDSSLFVSYRPDEAWSADDSINASTVLDEMERIAPL